MDDGVVINCESLEEVQSATSSLDVASLCDLKIIDNGIEKPVSNLKGIYNNSKGIMSTSVVPYYNLVLHKQYFDGFAEALDRLDIKFSMSIKQSGNRAFADIEFKDRNLKFEKLNEEFTTGIRLINSYNKSTGLHVIPRYTRLACTNGMIMTRSEKTLSIKHHSKIVSELQKFIELQINKIISQDNELNAWVSGAMKDSIEWNAACKIIGKLFTQIKHREEILKNLGISIITLTDKKTKKKSFTYVWDKKEDEKAKLTRWDLYNAITRYITNGEQITPHIENLFHKYAEKLLTTPLAKMPIEKTKL